MNNMLRTFLAGILRVLSQATIQRFKPEIIAITGSAGKTSTKDAIYTILKYRWRTRRNHDNFNNEIGVPLTILGEYKKSGGIFFWLPVLCRAVGQLILPRAFFRRPYPEVLVLEYGADRPGDIEYLVEIARPKIGVVTLIGKIPVHVEFYSGVESVAKEKEKLVRALSVSGFAVLNSDDLRVRQMAGGTRGEVSTYGFSDDSTMQIKEYEIEKKPEGDLKVPTGIRFILEYKNETIPVTVPGVVGKAQAYAIAAAALVGVLKGLKLQDISKSLSYYRAPNHRLTFVRGIKNSLILDDSYNSSPAAAHHAVEALSESEPKRSVCILGDMRELGAYTDEAHKSLGMVVAKQCDVLVTIGVSATIIADTALAQGMKKNQVYQFNNVEEAIDSVPKLIETGDSILIKASLAVGAEKLVKALRV